MNRREMLVLGLPLLLIGVGAVFLSAREKKRIERESGPLRTVITNIKVEEVTPFEAWQGFSHKVTLEAELWGNNPIPEGYSGNQYQSQLDSEVFLNGKISGENKRIGVGKRISEKWNVYTVDNSPLVSVYEWDSTKVRGFRTFLIRKKYFEASNLKLSGTVRIQQRAIKDRKNSSTAFPQGWQSVGKRIRNSIITRPALPSTFEIAIPNTTVQQVNKTAPKVIKSGKTSLSPYSEKTGMFAGEGETQIGVKLRPFNRDKSRLFTGPTEILDKNNRPVELPKDKRGFERNIRFSNSTIFKDGSIEMKRNIPVEDIPRSYGPLTYRTWLSYGDNWPVEVRIPLRTSRDLNTPKLLKLVSVQVLGGDVRVRVKYVGDLQVSSEDVSELLGTRYYYDYDVFRQNTFPSIDTSFEDRLISHWSQHLTASNGKEYWFKNAVHVKSITTVEINVYEIVYSTNALDALKAGEKMKFSAHVGIEGDGFIPIEATITKNK